ncbi:unnamed protein product [Peniophora sp. CBMAI 1063]|nr:unnamed protein product [Peniophora sp. CBMAI 1063]
MDTPNSSRPFTCAMCQPTNLPVDQRTLSLPPPAVYAKFLQDAQTRIIRLEQLVNTIVPVTRTLVENASRQPAPCEKFDRLVAGAICLRARGQTVENAMQTINGAHGFSAGQWGMYFLSRMEIIQPFVEAVLRPHSAVTSAPPTTATDVGHKRPRTE